MRFVVADDDDEVTIGGDAGWEFGGGLGFLPIAFLKELLGARFIIVKNVESVVFSTFASRSVVNVDVDIASFFESGLFGTSDTWGVSTVED